jgi:GT2 family glycosyltransferase
MGIRFPNFVLNIWNRKSRGAIGANMAMSRKALLSVNGYDADYQGYGMEETDLLWRLNQQGYSNKTVLGRCAMFHLYHKEKEQGSQANKMFEQKKKQNLTRCLNGIDQIRETE